MKAKSTLSAIVLAAIILFCIIFVPTASATTDESMEKWTKDHTIKNVKLTKIYKYEEGYLKINEIYSSSELKKKTGLNEFNKEMKIPLETGTVMVNSEDDKLVVTENELILTSKKSGTIKLQKGKEKVYTTKTSIVITHESEPYPWWNSYDGPQWTWSKFLWWYVREDPINLLWGESDISEVKDVIVDEGNWVRNPSEYTHYIYDQTKHRWIADQGVAETRYRILGGYHARLWEISTNADDVVIANAHEDDGVFEWQLGHQVIEYEDAEYEVARYFENVGWNVYYDKYFLDNECTTDYGRENYGSATVIDCTL